MTRTAKTILATTFLVAGLAACGSEDDGGAVAGGDDATSTSTTATPDEGGGDGAAEGEAAPSSDKVDIVDFAFSPAEITVAAGTTVTWTNQDDAAHSIADREQDEESDDLAQGDTFELTYDESGEFPYVCGIHNYMKGTVTVE